MNRWMMCVLWVSEYDTKFRMINITAKEDMSIFLERQKKQNYLYAHMLFYLTTTSFFVPIISLLADAFTK